MTTARVGSRPPCPNPEALERFLRDEVARAEARAVEEHVAACADCQVVLYRLVGSMPDPFVRPPGPPGRAADDGPPALPGYEPVGRIGADGAGVVWRVRDPEFGRTLAVTVMKAEAGDDPRAVRRFLAEARITARLDHPGVVPVYGFGTDAAGLPYFATRLVCGENFQEVIKAHHTGATVRGFVTTPGARQLVRIFLSVCQTVAHAHSRRILHRDLKPANILVGPFGEALVIGWGLARCLDGPAGGVGATRGEPGSLAYMSPEQADERDEDVGEPADIYALGATLYEILTNKRQVVDPATPADKIRRGDIPRPRFHKPGVDRALEAVCRKAMAVMPADRYASAVALAEDVERWLDGQPVRAWREPFATRAGRWLRRQATLLVVPAVGIVLALAGGGARPSWW